MASYYSSSGRSSGWIQAFIFNSLLILVPVMAARIVAIAFSVQGFGATPTAAAVSETRKSVDSAFERLAPSSADQRSYWADLVDRELRAKDMSAARGFLLAAPHMFDGADVRAIRAAAEAEITGSEDERIARAALLFLPNDVRARYERAIRPPSITMPEPSDDLESGEADPLDGDAGSREREVAAAPEPTATPARFTSSPRFSMLGDYADLADHSRRWIRGEQVDPFVLRLTGLGMTAQSTRDEPVDIELSASIIKAARRAGRLHPTYERFLNQRLNAVVSEDVLGPQLAEALEDITTSAVAAERVKAVFAASIRSEALPRLEEDFVQINRIAEVTSPTGAIALIEHAKSSEDIRRGRLIAEAGGDRSAALAKQMGADVLDLAETGVAWSRMLMLQIAGLGFIALALVWTVISVMARSFARPPRPAAII